MSLNYCVLRHVGKLPPQTSQGASGPLPCTPGVVDKPPLTYPMPFRVQDWQVDAHGCPLLREQ